jgi:hypothetical protein
MTVTTAGKVDGEVGQIGRADGLGPPEPTGRTPRHVAPEIAAVRRQGVARQASLDHKVVEVVPDRAL